MNVSAASAVTLLSRPVPPPMAGRDRLLPSERILASVNGAAAAHRPDEPRTPEEKAKLAESFFSVTEPPSVQQMKLDLYDRVGRVFDLKRTDFEDLGSFGTAIKIKLERWKAEAGDNATAMVSRIEKDLGLDKLGVTIYDVIAAMIDDKGSASEKLGEALQEKNGESKEDKESRRIAQDELGLYKPTSAAS